MNDLSKDTHNNLSCVLLLEYVSHHNVMSSVSYLKDRPQYPLIHKTAYHTLQNVYHDLRNMYHIQKFVKIADLHCFSPMLYYGLGGQKSVIRF